MTTAQSAYPPDITVGRRRSPLSIFTEMIKRGGPLPADYATFSVLAGDLQQEMLRSKEHHDAISATIRVLTATSLQGTLQAHSLLKPHGYAGDFEISDYIYTRRMCADPYLSRWDEFFHAQSATQAMRDRKDYFHRRLKRLAASCSEEPRVLNVGSGPGRDMKEWFDHSTANAPIFDCLELDLTAIRYAQELCSAYADRITFHRANALRFSTEKRFDLVWSAGLFDYFSDSLFAQTLSRILRFTKAGGEVIIGTFGEFNPSRIFMEVLAGWNVIHRSEENLAGLAIKAGADPSHITVGSDSEGVNLYLHVRKA